MRILLWMMGIFMVIVWGLSLIFQVFGIFAWFLLAFGAISIILGFRAAEEM